VVVVLPTPPLPEVIVMMVPAMCVSLCVRDET
jgi:hypothetical protein